MSRKLALSTIAAACALCFALVGCGGGSSSQGAPETSAPVEAATSEAAAPVAEAPSSAAETSAPAASEAAAPAAETSAPAAEAPASAAAAEDNHDAFFVGKWDLYESEDATHEQIVEVMEQYANDEEVRAQLNEAYGRDNIEFCARFNADGTGEIDTGAELVSFTWEATNDGAVTFTSFDGKETAIHVPVTDGMFDLNGDVYAKAE